MPICLIIDTAVPRKGRQIAGEAKLCHTNAITQLVRALRSITPNDDLRAVAFNGLYRKGTELSAATRDYDKLLSAISALDTSFETTCSVADALSGIFQEHTQLNVPIGRPCHFVLVTANEALLEGGPQNQPNGLPTYCELHLLVVRHPTPPTAKRDLDSTSTDPEPPAKRIKTEAAEVKHEPGTLVNSANEGVRSNDRAVGTEGPAALPNTAEGQAEAPTTSQLMKADGMIEVSSIPNPSALALLCRSICGVNYTTDVTPDLTSPMNALAGSCYTPYSGHLALGHLTDRITLYPTPPKYTLRLKSSTEMRPLSDVLSIVGFVDNATVRPLPILSRHVVLSSKLEEGEPSLWLMLYESLMANTSSAVVELSREWFGLISCQKDFYNRDKTNLVLSVIKPQGEIVWRMDENAKVLLDIDPPLHLEQPSSAANTQESSFGPNASGLVWMHQQSIASYVSKVKRHLQSINDRMDRLETLMVKINRTIAVYHLTGLKAKILKMLEEKLRDVTISEASQSGLQMLINELVS